MPRVPVPAGNLVEQRPTTDAKFRAANDGGGVLGGLGEGLQRAGNLLANFADAQDRLDQQFDEAATKQQLTAYATFRSQMLSTGENAFLTTQGQNALTARPLTEKALDDKIAELRGGLKSPRAQQMFAQSVGLERMRDGEAIASHSVRQLGAWHDATDSALQATAGQDFIGATLRGDADAADFARGTLTNSLRAQYARNGLTGEPETLALNKAMSALHSSVIDAKSQADPVAAAAYLDAHAAELLPTDRTKLADSLYGPLVERSGIAVVDSFAEHLSMEAPPLVVPAGGGALLPRMIAITLSTESGNRDYVNGKIVTSPKGAQGAMQTMPGTQRDPGFGIRPAQDGSVAEKNRVGRDYLAVMTKRYDGDAAKAWAAYNAGPGRVDAALKHGDAWLAHMPAETQGYVRKNMAMLGGNDTPTYSPRRDDLAGIYAYIQAQNLPFDVEKAALAEADRRVARNDRLLNRQQDDAKDAAYGVIDRMGDGFTSINQLPPSIRRGLSPEALHSLRATAEQNARPKAVEANGGAIVNLHQLANLDPDAFKKRDLRLDRPNMTASEYDQIATLQSQMLAKVDSPAQVSHSRIWSTISRFAADVGLDLSTKGGKPSKPEDRADSMRLFSIMQGTLQTITEGKRAPTDDEIKKAFDNAVMPVVRERSGWFGSSSETVPRFRDASKPTNSVAVPSAAADRIRAGLRARGLPSDDQSVARFYIQAKR
ncbi:transglycosylase SLT domain-containing protein [Sphingomonas sp.]|uniref:transglycosylase SLT domain-containing protein n=1 Tax=Sphingomonas sp. TaxID=28214 RepID=UPI0035C82766